MITLLSADIDVIFDDFLLPIFVCVVLPCVIVFIVMWQRRNEINRKTEVALKAIESGAQVDPNFFAPAEKAKKPRKSRKEMVFRMLRDGLILASLGTAFVTISVVSAIKGEAKTGLMTAGIIILFLGVGFIISWAIGKQTFAAEIEAEEKQAEK